VWGKEREIGKRGKVTSEEKARLKQSLHPNLISTSNPQMQSIKYEIGLLVSFESGTSVTFSHPAQHSARARRRIGAALSVLPGSPLLCI
jgi:hypothetical protein